MYPQVKKLNEKRQLFNAYKTQKQKDEKDEHRLKAKKAKEDLEKFLMKNEDVTSKTKYYRLEERYEHLDVSINGYLSIVATSISQKKSMYII